MDETTNIDKLLEELSEIKKENFMLRDMLQLAQTQNEHLFHLQQEQKNIIATLRHEENGLINYIQRLEQELDHARAGISDLASSNIDLRLEREERNDAFVRREAFHVRERNLLESRIDELQEQVKKISVLSPKTK